MMRLRRVSGIASNSTRPARCSALIRRRTKVAPKKSPASRQINQSALAIVDIDSDEVADALMDVLLHGVAPIDTGTNLAEHLVPRAPNLCMQIATQRRQILIEVTITIARNSCRESTPCLART